MTEPPRSFFICIVNTVSKEARSKLLSWRSLSRRFQLVSAEEMFAFDYHDHPRTSDARSECVKTALPLTHKAIIGCSNPGSARHYLLFDRHTWFALGECDVESESGHDRFPCVV